MRFSIYRFDPDKDKQPYMQDFNLNDVKTGTMLRDALLRIKNEQDDSLSFRHSCGEGVCGSDGMNINGDNGLACITAVEDLVQPIIVRPLPGMPVIRDLIIDMKQFYAHYRAVKPWLIVDEPVPETEFKQTPEQREQLDGLYECILCACCSTACPSFWWNTDKYHGPAALLQSWRFLTDSRDQASDERLQALEGPHKLYRCHSIMSCVQACPKNLNPTQAIGRIKKLMLKNML